VYPAREAGGTLLVCYGCWEQVQTLMKMVNAVARGLGKGTGFSVEAVDVGAKRLRITTEQRQLLSTWTF